MQSQSLPLKLVLLNYNLRGFFGFFANFVMLVIEVEPMELSKKLRNAIDKYLDEKIEVVAQAILG